MKITVQDKEVLAQLSRLKARLNNMRPAMDEMGGAIADRVRLGFNDARSPYGAKWDPLSAVTVSRRRGGSSKPLNDTGRLRNSVFHRASGSSVEIGLSAKYAGTHQFGARQGKYGRTRRGAPIPWGTISARPMLPIKSNRVVLPGDWEGDVVDAVKGHLLPSR